RGEGGGCMDGVGEVRVRGLDVRDAHELLSSVVGGPMGPQLADRIVSETRGNPLALVELGGELTADHLAGASMTDPLPVSELIQARFLRQVPALPPRPPLLRVVSAGGGGRGPARGLRVAGAGAVS